jgi:2-oxoglutarate ferredoxin oxidoreductase subunit delta
VAVVKKAAPAVYLQIRQDWCKGCGICAAFCPKRALSLNDQGKAVVDAAQCSLCGVCELFCPDFAIQLETA